MASFGTWRSSVVEMLRREEGVLLVVYDDASGAHIGPGSVVVGHPTIGVGRCLDRRGITPAEAEALLGNDVDAICADLDAALPWWRSLSQQRQTVLVGMAFQIGMTGLLGFKGTLAAIEAGHYGEAADRMLASAWARQTPARAQRMAAMMRSG